jgi:hypothetical protein
MSTQIKLKMIQICNDKIHQKGEGVGLSLYAFFENKNTNPELLMEVANWWIMENKFDHFEKAVKIRDIVFAMG